MSRKELPFSEQKSFFYSISPSNEPTLTIDPGETVIIETENALLGWERTFGKTSVGGTSNPLSGPVFVRGAEKGDTLVVEIKEVTPLNGQAVTAAYDLVWPLGENSTTKFLDVKIPSEQTLRKECLVEDGKVHWSDRIVLPYEPMIGEIGTAPETVMPNPGAHGGNMDLPDVGPGNRLFLPVFVRGALLHIGDAHSLQGDCELSGTALEMAAKCVLRIDLMKHKNIVGPRIESSDYIMSVASATMYGTSLRDAIRMAFMELILWLEEEYEFDRWEAYQLCTQVAKVRVGNIMCVAAKFPKRYLR